MPTTLADKLALKPDDKVFVVNAPKRAPPSVPGVAKAIDLADAVVVYAVAERDLSKHVATVKATPAGRPPVDLLSEGRQARHGPRPRQALGVDEGAGLRGRSAGVGRRH